MVTSEERPLSEPANAYKRGCFVDSGPARPALALGVGLIGIKSICIAMRLAFPFKKNIQKICRSLEVKEGRVLPGHPRELQKFLKPRVSF
jgi:hypothetical protein